tara:strand:+ start:25 stop:402 length:378 start_codon:yes stop_codon:yes gene_type:complete
MIDLKETAEQRVSEAISEVLKSHSLTTLARLSTDLDSLLGGVNDASEVDGINRSDIKCTLELLIEAVEFATDDIKTGSSEEWWEENIGSDPEEEEEEEEGSMPNGISILNTTVCRNLNLPPIEEK